MVIEFMPDQPSDACRQLSDVSAIILCGGMGKRMREETRGKISKVELPIPLLRDPEETQASETAVGLLVRSLRHLEALKDVTLLTSKVFALAHTRLASELAARYGIDVRCHSDSGCGDEFPPNALLEMTEQIARPIEQNRPVLVLNGDTLVGPEVIQDFARAISADDPLIALGETESMAYLGLLFLSGRLKWRELTRDIAAASSLDLLFGLSQRVPILTVKLEGRIYDCGSPDGYRAACAAGASGELWRAAAIQARPRSRHLDAS